MNDVEKLAGAILDQLDIDPGVKEFKRTVQHDDGSSETFRIDVTEMDATHFVVAVVRQRGDRGRQESGPRTFARGDRQGFARWLQGDPPQKRPRGGAEPD